LVEVLFTTQFSNLALRGGVRRELSGKYPEFKTLRYLLKGILKSMNALYFAGQIEA
jgi:hypothetical protein